MAFQAVLGGKRATRKLILSCRQASGHPTRLSKSSTLILRRFAEPGLGAHGTGIRQVSEWRVVRQLYLPSRARKQADTLLLMGRGLLRTAHLHEQRPDAALAGTPPWERVLRVARDSPEDTSAHAQTPWPSSSKVARFDLQSTCPDLL